MKRWWLAASTFLVGAVGWSQAAAADPISAAILTTVGITAATVGAEAFAAAVAVTTFALTTAATAALSYGATRLTQRSTATPGGFQAEVQYGGDVSRQIAFGVTRTAGQFVWFAGVGDKNKVLHLVYALADWECDGLDHVYVDDVKKTLTSVAPDGGAHAKYQVQGFGSNFTINFFRGTMAQAADTTLIAASAARVTGLGPWTANHRGAGICYVHLTLTFDEALFQTGIPQVEYQLRGAKLYDRRNPAHVWADPTTWAFSKNPIVMEENYRRGFFRGAVRVLGMGVAGADLLGDHYVAAANVCDEPVSEGAGTPARYECSTIINDDAEYRTATDTFMSACAGVVVEKAGLFGPFAGAAQATVATLTSQDLILGYDTSFQAKAPREDLFNAVYGTYTRIGDHWQTDSFPPVTNPAWEVEDNNERFIKDIQLPQVTSGFQASRIAKIIANKGRRQARHVGVYGPKFATVEAGDWVTFTGAHGSYTMLVAAKREVALLQFQFSLEETHATVYGGAATAPATPPVVVVVTPSSELNITGFAVSPVSIAGAGGQIRPGIQVNWTPPGDPSVKAVRIEYRVLGTSVATPVTMTTPVDGVFVIQSDLMAGTTYEVRARYVLEPDITTAANWSAWLQVLTTSNYIVQSSKIATDTQEYFDRFEQEVEGSGLSQLYEALARFNEDDNTRVELNTHITQVSAANEGSFAQTTLKLSALASQDAAFAEALIQISAIAGGSTANGAFKMEAVASEGTATASIAAFVSADNGQSFTRAGYRLDVEAGGVGRFVVMADQFAITQNAGSVPFTPFAVIGPDTFVNRLVVNDEILSDNFELDGSGLPAMGFRLSQDGIAEAVDARFTDFQARGGSITQRPLLLAQPNFRNGICECVPAISWSSPNFIEWNPALTWGSHNVSMYHRTPDAIYLGAVQYSETTNTNGRIVKQQFMIPHGKRLPPLMVADLDGNVNTVEWRDDGKLYRVQYNANGGVIATNEARGNWIYDVERDPQNLDAVNKVIAGLGYTRYPQPWVVPEFLANGTTLVTSIAFKAWGAGGALDDAPSTRGGPGGYTAATFAVGARNSSALIKRGDILWFIPGEGGRTKSQDVTFGFGGRGQSQQRRSGGGGLSGVFIHRILRANALVISGGGGAAQNGANGGPGGAALSGSNGVSGTDDEIMTGLPWTFDGTLSKGGAGGGYVGGGWLPTGSGNHRGGRGGSNFVHASGTSVTNSAANVDANGGATSTNPPNNADADYVANQYCLGVSARAGQGKTSTTIVETAGNGLIVATIA